MGKPSYAEVIAERNALREDIKALKRELAGRTGRVVGVHKPEPIIFDLTPTAGTPRFGAPRPAPKPGAKKR